MLRTSDTEAENLNHSYQHFPAETSRDPVAAVVEMHSNPGMPSCATRDPKAYGRMKALAVE